MIQKFLLFPNKHKKFFLDKNDIYDFIPITISEPKENIFQNIDDNYSFLSKDESESFYNINISIEGNDKNNNIFINSNRFINPFPEINKELEEIIISDKEFRKSEDEQKTIIFEILKDKERRKNLQIKRQRNNIKSPGKKININDKYFPFNEPKGLTSYFDFKFYTKKYSIKENGKIGKIPKRRKFKSDNIHKKIKSRFHKELKNILNKNLKKCGSKKFFDYLPQCFISNVSKITNSKYLNLTYKELLSIDFQKNLNSDDCITNKFAHNKYLKNIEILNYLEQNPEISKLSGFSAIKDKKYKELLENYFNSSQFEKSILKLKKEKESSEYIIKYITKAKNYVDFYAMDKF